MILPGNLSALYLERQHSHQKVDFLGARQKMKKVFCDKRTSGSPDLRSCGQRLSIPTIRAGPIRSTPPHCLETYVSRHPLQFGRTGSCRSSCLPFPKLSTCSAPLMTGPGAGTLRCPWVCCTGLVCPCISWTGDGSVKHVHGSVHLCDIATYTKCAFCLCPHSWHRASKTLFSIFLSSDSYKGVFCYLNEVTLESS